MTDRPGENEALYSKVDEAWKKGVADGTIAADKTFYGLTNAQFEAAIQPSIDARTKLAAAELDVTNWTDKRTDADVNSVAVSHGVVNAVKGDPAFGENSSLYGEMGYVRASAKASGLTRKNAAQAKVEKAAAKAVAQAAKAMAKADTAAARAAAAKVAA